LKGALLCSCSLDKTIKIWDIGGGQPIRNIICPSPLSSIQVDALENTVFVAADNQNIYAYSLQSEKKQTL